MMKAAATSEDGKSRIAIVGLSTENVRRLLAGQPIKTSTDFLGIDGELVIFVGDTEESMAKDLGSMIGPETVVHRGPVEK